MSDDQLRCLRCSASMERGYLGDRGHGDDTKVAQWIGGEPEVHWYGIKTSGHEKIPLTAFRCGKCGYIELHARRDADA